MKQAAGKVLAYLVSALLVIAIVWMFSSMNAAEYREAEEELCLSMNDPYIDC
jgi:hypothetical protein